MPKKGNAKECSNYHTIALISHTRKILPQILQARLQQYVNFELLYVQAGFRKGKGNRNQIANISWIIEKAREFQKKHLFLLYWLCQSLWLCGSQQTVENSERDGNTRPPDMPLEKPVCRSGSNSYNWTWNNRLVPNRKWSTSRLYLVTLLFNLYAEYIMRNAGLMKHKLESRLPGEMSITSDMQMTPPLWQKVKKN